MGCCLPKSDYSINKKAELVTNRSELIKKNIQSTSKNLNMNNHEIIDSNKQRELETEIPNRTELQIPLMKIDMFANYIQYNIYQISNIY